MKRRTFLKNAAATAGLMSFPVIVPSSVFAQTTPNDKINVAQIGCGRIARTHDMPQTIKSDLCRVVAVADFDLKRAKDGKKWVEDYYTKKTGKSGYVDVKVCQDYHELLADKSIDAVVISTPDHWHAQPAAEAAIAGKDIYLQKPASLTIEEGRFMSNVITKNNRIFQIGSQQRSRNPWPQFKRVCELVRNEVLGRIKHIDVGLGTDPAGDFWPRMPVPETFNYDMWLGSTPRRFYTEKCVHPQDGLSRPGWLRVRQFGAGMITGWGAHHLDIAHWGMGTELTGPIEAECVHVEFPKSGLWNVHGDFEINVKYANGVTMNVSSKHPNGVRFECEDGWIFVSRGNAKVTDSDPVPDDPNNRALRVSDPKFLKAKIGPHGIHLYESPEQHLNWLECIRSRRQTVAPVEVAHRSCSACLILDIAMRVPGKLHWDPDAERFIDNVEANKRISRPQRFPYGTNYVRM